MEIFKMDDFLKGIEARSAVRTRVVLLAKESLRKTGNKYDMNKSDLDELYETAVDSVTEEKIGDVEHIQILRDDIAGAVAVHIAGVIKGDEAKDFMGEFRKEFDARLDHENWEKLSS